ncbi:hypothetical protein SNOG_15961 [Parastagonospora nodorum SN15]|uniref:Uncharacterized protein n=1 Tax=Phaeosphaeria nodorum (strain SN15 / ATCC MYA-4574 / FGSC 10173) TaxID=321614 RepID=Q0TWP0_PHANO|nr:hypothetical protein SNOG_15961 [Parastagonospora nodorum SN15]EAT76540.1 hypothetical protein SNOG_15961 [Parastagonospora nodorum SN15]
MRSNLDAGSKIAWHSGDFVVVKLSGKRADKGKAAQTEDAPPDTTIEHFQQSPGSERTCLTSSVVQAPRQGFGVATPGTFSGGLLYDVSFLSFENSSGEDLLPNLFAPSQEAIHDLPSTHRSSTGGDQILDDRNASSAAASPPQNETHLTSIESSAHMGGNQASWHETSASRASSSPSDIGSDVPKWLSPLHMASLKGQTRITRILLEHNADCNEQDSDGHTPLMHAVMSGSEEMIGVPMETREPGYSKVTMTLGGHNYTSPLMKNLRRLYCCYYNLGQIHAQGSGDKRRTTN